MADYYTTQTISGYNSSPPVDDGSEVEANRTTWSKHKDKLGDPIKTLAEAINTELLSAFGKMFFNNITSVATDTTIGVSDLGKLISVTGTQTITLPAVATAGQGFVVTVLNSGSGVVTIDGDGSETVNGAATQTLQAGDFALLTTTGATGWKGPITSGGVGSLTPTADNFIVGDGAAWTTETPSQARTSLGLGSLATLGSVDTAQIATDAVTADKIAAEAVGSSELATDAVDSAEIATGAIHQPELDTSLQQSTGNLSGGGNQTDLSFTGGEYTLGWGLAGSTSAGADRFELVSHSTGDYTAGIGIRNSTGGSLTYFLQARYVNASAPYDLGDGEIPEFYFLLMDKSGRIAGIDVSKAPPWVYNGPTKTTADKRDKQGRQYVRRLVSDTKAAPLPPTGQSKEVEWSRYYEALAQYRAGLEWDYVELTPALKNADMDIIPHPFGHRDFTDLTVVLLDPVSSIVDTLAVLRDDGRGEDVSNILNQGLIRIDNGPLPRNGPKGVQIVSARWK